MHTKLFGLLLLGLVSHAMCENWALLVAGSNGWYNYRHQADVCHSYQMLHKKGFPDERIVVMMYDDIAQDSSNPTPGEIINYPNGPDVYKGVPKDYTKDDVNPKNFLNVLSGNAEAMKGIGSGKVIASGPDDKIFVFFSDHGATNLIAFPSDYLYADDLIKTLKSMYTNKQYKELVFYLEACESGSMFNGLLPDNMNIYTTTAANPCQSSYACYYDETRQTYLGDCYSVNWMVDTEHHNENKETFEQQYQIIKKETNMSQVCQYGQLSMTQETLGNFLESSDSISRHHLVNRPFLGERNAVDQRDVELSILTHRLRVSEQRDEIESQIREIMNSRRNYDDLFHSMALKLVGSDYPRTLVLEQTNKKFDDAECKKCEEYVATQNMECLKEVIRGIENSCGKFSHYGLGFSKWISRMCNLGIRSEEMNMVAMEFCS